LIPTFTLAGTLVTKCAVDTNIHTGRYTCD